MSITESVQVRYRNAAHKRFAAILSEFGFEMTLDSRLNVGLVFFHPSKFHVVILETDDGQIFDPKFIACIRPPHGSVEHVLQALTNGILKPDHFEIATYPEQYSDGEWQFILHDLPTDGREDPDEPFKVLEREAHIWVKVRPRTMNTMLAHPRT